MSILVFGKHHANIRRLIAGEETKIGARHPPGRQPAARPGQVLADLHAA